MFCFTDESFIRKDHVRVALLCYGKRALAGCSGGLEGQLGVGGVLWRDALAECSGGMLWRGSQQEGRQEASKRLARSQQEASKRPGRGQQEASKTCSASQMNPSLERTMAGCSGGVLWRDALAGKPARRPARGQEEASKRPARKARGQQEASKTCSASR